MLQVGCGSVGLIFPCAIIGAAKHAVATTKNRKFFIWTSSLVSVLAIVSEKRCEYIYQIEEILKLDGSEMGFRPISKFSPSPNVRVILRLSSPSGNAVLLCATMFCCARRREGEWALTPVPAMWLNPRLCVKAALPISSSSRVFKSGRRTKG